MPSARSTSYATIEAPSPDAEWVDVDAETVRRALREKGAVLFRGFRGDLDRFAAMTDRHCVGYMANPVIGREVVDEARSIQTVNLSNEPFPLHGERCQTPFRPDLCWFYCRRPAGEGGETVLCDGAAIAAALPVHVRSFLLGRRLRYRTRTPIEHMLVFLGLEHAGDINPTLEARSLDHIYRCEDDHVMQDYTVPVLPLTRYGKEPAFCNFLFFARYMLRLVDYPSFEDGSVIPHDLCNALHDTAVQLSVAVPWQGGDLVMVDNSRVMHGRNWFPAPEQREIWTRFGYAGF